MRNVFTIAVLLAVIIMTPLAASGQATPLSSRQVTTSMVSSLPFLGSFSELYGGHVSWSARASFGWKHLGLGYSLDLGYQNFGVLNESPLEIAVNQTYLWTGKVDAASKVSKRI